MKFLRLKSLATSTTSTGLAKAQQDFYGGASGVVGVVGSRSRWYLSDPGLQPTGAND